MNTRPTDGSNDVSTQWLEKHLKSLSAVSPPETLRQRLLADVARAAAVGPGERGAVHRWSRAVRYVAATAAVIVATCAIVRLGLPSRRGQGPVADHNEQVSLVAAADYNSPRPVDMNVCDNNGVH